MLSSYIIISVVSGIGSTVPLIVLAMTVVLSTILCCCLWWVWQDESLRIYDLVYCVTRQKVLSFVHLHVSCRWKRHSSHGKGFKGIISTQKTSQNTELNEPVAMANLVTLKLDDVNDTEVDNQVPPDPGIAGNNIGLLFYSMPVLHCYIPRY